MQKDGCYRHSQISRQNKRKAMKVYKQSEIYKRQVEERCRRLRLREELKKENKK